MKCHLDYETRSESDLKVDGVYVYAQHPSTLILCCGYSIDGGPIQMWYAATGEDMPADLAAAMRNPKCEMHAWNAQFERLITKHVARIDIPQKRWRCTAALARARGLPGKLEDALRFLKLDGDAKEKRRGSQIMLKWCKPLPAHRGGGWADDPGEYVELTDYCAHDVVAEMAVDVRLDPLKPWEIKHYELTEEINDRGLPVDLALAQAAAGYGAEETQALNLELATLTGGEVTSSKQHARVKAWLKDRLGEEMFARFFVREKRTKSLDGDLVTLGQKETTDKAARLDFLQSEDAKEAPADVREALEIIDDAGKASVAKYAKIAARAALGGRAQGAYIFCGAIQTKRFSSVGMQMHNLPRDVPENVDEVIAAIMARKPIDGVPVMHTLASLLRPTVMAPKGHTLIWGDWSAVEARAMPWLAGAKRKLDLYRQKVDVYRVNAENIFGTPYDEVSSDQRQVGKVAELSLQFGGSMGALKNMARNYGISLGDAMAGDVVAAWRQANKWAMEFSKGLFTAFAKTCLGTDSSHGPISYRQIRSLLPGTLSIACDLPGGVSLYYHGIHGKIGLRHRSGVLLVEIEEDMAGWDGADISQWDSDVRYHKCLPASFFVDRLWHGLLAENVTQGVCASLLRDCTMRVSKGLKSLRLKATLVGHTHDEMVLQSSIEHADEARRVLRQEMERVPEWLSGFPLNCEVNDGPRYVK